MGIGCLDNQGILPTGMWGIEISLSAGGRLSKAVMIYSKTHDLDFLCHW
jgi:hypothetical protein